MLLHKFPPYVYLECGQNVDLIQKLLILLRIFPQNYHKNPISHSILFVVIPILNFLYILLLIILCLLIILAIQETLNLNFHCLSYLGNDMVLCQ